MQLWLRHLFGYLSWYLLREECHNNIMIVIFTINVQNCLNECSECTECKPQNNTLLPRKVEKKIRVCRHFFQFISLGACFPRGMLFLLILIKINLITLQGFGKSEARISKLFTLCQAFQVSTVTGKKKFVFWSVGWVYIVHLVRSLVHSFGWFVCLLCLFIIYLFISVLVYSFTCLFFIHSFVIFCLLCYPGYYYYFSLVILSYVTSFL